MVQNQTYDKSKKEIKLLLNKISRMEYLEEVFHHVPVPILILDERQSILSTNLEVEKLTGLSSQDLAGKKCYHVFHDPTSSAPPASCPFKELLLQGEAYPVEGVEEGLQGTFLISLTPIFDENRKIKRVIHICRDISGWKSVEHALQRSETLLRETQALTGAGGWELHVQSGRVTWTDEVYRIYGVEKDIFDPSDIERGLSFFTPEAQAVLKKAFTCALERGKPYDLELRFIRADGKKLWVRTIGRPEVINDNVVRINGYFMDITHDKQMEHRYKRTSNLLENVYKSLEEAVFVVDPHSRVIVSCNAAAEKMFGYRKEEMLGKNSAFLHVNQSTYRWFGQEVKRAIEKEGWLQIEFNLKRKDGTIFPSEHTVKEVRDDSGLPVMHVSVVRDISSQKKAEEALRSKQTELQQKTDRLSELNTALKVLLEQRDHDKKELEERLVDSVSGLILPYMKKIRKTGLSDLQREYIDILESNLRDIASPYQHIHSAKLMHLSSTEIRVANLVKKGYRIKEIAAELNISPRTVEYHRNNIRQKLGIKGRKINLRTFLSNIS